MWYHKYMKYVFSAVFTKEDGGYVAICPELGVASQGDNLKEAEYNIKEAVELYIENISQDELVAYKQESFETPLLKTFEVSLA